MSSILSKKICYKCGKKSSTLYDGLCEECYKIMYPPLKEIKKITLKYCNSCKKISYNNRYYEKEEFAKLLTNIMKKKVVIDKRYTLNEILIEDLEIKEGKINFRLEVDCKLN